MTSGFVYWRLLTEIEFDVETFALLPESNIEDHEAHDFLTRRIVAARRCSPRPTFGSLDDSSPDI